MTQDHWIERIDQLTKSMAAAPEPLTFLIGAGASLSSGAPSTDAVRTALMRRKSPEEVEELYRTGTPINDTEKRNLLRPLFENTAPQIGYRCMGALAHERQVVIVNLNWDDLVERACPAGVECRSYDLRLDARAIKDTLEEGSPGVVVVHVHGHIAGQVRFWALETAYFEGAEQAVLKKCFERSTIVAGVSFDDLDSGQMLKTMEAKRSTKARQQDPKPLWVFSRQDDRSDDPTRRQVASVMHGRQSDDDFVGGPLVDFDRLLVELRAADSGRHYDDLRTRHKGRPLPRRLNFVLPKPTLVAPHLDQLMVGHATAPILIVAEPLIGKTAVAHMLAHWASIMSRDEVAVNSASRPGECMSRIAEAQAAQRDTNRCSVLILEEPFGDVEYMDNPRFLAAVAELARAGCPTIVCSEPDVWQRAVGTSDAEANFAVVSSSPDDWYSDEDLAAFADQIEPGAGRRLLTRPFDRRQVTTPARVREAVFGDTIAGGEGDVVEQKVRFLDACADSKGTKSVTRLLVLARLQELSDQPVSAARLSDAAGTDADDVRARSKGMLHEFEHEGERYLRLAHTSDLKAVDRWMASHSARIRSMVSGLSVRAPWTRPAREIWKLIMHRPISDKMVREDLTEEQVLRWGPLLVDRLPGDTEKAWDVVQALSKRTDSWGVRELAHEIVRLWPSLRTANGRSRVFLEDLLTDEDRAGTYAALEAVLYLPQHPPPPHALWRRVQSRIADLIEAPDPPVRELALVFDALLWRSMPDEPGVHSRFLHELLELAEDHPALWGGYVFAGIYHPHGLSEMRTTDREKIVAGLRRLDEPAAADLAAQVIRWHFVHQSRGRAVMSRRAFESLEGDASHRYLSRSPHPEPLASAQADRVREFIEQLVRHEVHAGWGVHLAMNVNATLGTMDLSWLATTVRQVEDGDEGLIAAAMTYLPAPEALHDPLRQYFSRRANWETFMDRVRDGVPVDGVCIEPPRFLAAGNPADFDHVVGSKWLVLSDARFDTGGREHLLRELRSVAPAVAAAGDVDKRWVEEVLRRGERGDLRPLDSVPFRSGSDRYFELLHDAAVVLSQTQ